MFVLLSILVLGLLIVVHELGHFLVARGLGIRVTRFSIGFGPTLLRWRGPEVEYVLGALPLGGYVAFPEDDAENGIAADDPDLLKNRSVRDRILVLIAGVAANFVFTYVLLFGMVALGGVPEPKYQPGVLIQQIVNAEAAGAKAGLKAGDVILAADGKTLPTGQEGIEGLRALLSSHPNRPVTLVVSRPAGQSQLVATPDATGKLGITLSPNGTVVRRPPRDVGELFTSSGRTFVNVAASTLGGFAQLLSGRAGFDQLSGPVGIVAASAEAARTDVFNLFYVGALISFNLAILNLLPLPALDGGQLAFVLVEALRGKPLPERIQQGVNQAGLMVLLGLGLFLILRDSLNLLKG